MKIEYKPWPSEGLVRIGFDPFGYFMILATAIVSGSKYGGLGADKKTAKIKLLKAIKDNEN